MVQGDWIDPLTGVRLIPLPTPAWYGASARVSTPIAPLALALEPVPPLVTYYWTANGFLPYRQPLGPEEPLP